MKRASNMKAFFTFLLLCFILEYKCQNSKMVNYNDYISTILQHHPLTKRAENEKKYAELQYKAARGNYDPLISGSYDQKQFNGSHYFTILNGEIKQPIFTSQYIKFGYDYGIGANVNPELSTSPQGLPYLGLEAGVLQGLLIDKRRAEVLKSREYLNYYDSERQIQINNLLFEASQRYVEWLFSTKQIALNNYFMQTAKDRLKGIEALAEIGERPPIDTIEAAIFFQTRLLDLQAATIENQKSTNELSAFNWQNGNPEPLTMTYIPMDSFDLAFTKVKNVAMEIVYQNKSLNPVLSKYNSLSKVLEVEKRFKKELIKPVLNLKYNLLSYNPSSITPLFSTNNYKWGLNLAFPLLLRNATNDYKMANVQLQNNNLELLNKTNELNVKLNALQQTLSILSEQLQNAERSANYSKQLVEAERLKFTNGESSLFMLNTRENKWLESELKWAEYKLKFMKTVFNVIYLNGNLNYKL